MVDNTKKMKAAIVNPYLDTMGGGERYSLSFALALLSKGYEVEVEWKDSSIKGKLEKRFGMDLSNLNFVENVKRGDGYDVCFWVSDGSIPILRARKNFLHFQVPFTDVNGSSLLNKMKFFKVNKIICNSFFTKEIIDKEYGVDSVVIYPPVDVEKIKSKRKENMILFVGRFSQLKQAKNQDVLIKAFKKFHDAGNADWKLVLAGGVEVGVGDYVEKLEKMIGDYPVKIVKSPDFNTIKYLFGHARFYWSAVGFGADEKKEPEKVEHFGISLVEAMAGGAVPVVYNAGGYKEIVSDGETGFFFKKVGDLVKITKKMVKEKGKLRDISKRAKEASKVYEYERFVGEITSFI